jgi:hypothetical protein
MVKKLFGPEVVKGITERKWGRRWKKVPALKSCAYTEILEEAEEGCHLYIDFVRREIQRNGPTSPPMIITFRNSSEHER